MAYSRTYDIPYFLIDQNRKLRITALTRFLEDMAIRHSDALGVGLDFYEQNQVAWVLAKWDIQVHRYPRFKEQVRVTTEPTSFRNFFGYRKYEIHSESGTLLAGGHSLWVFIDMNRKRPTPVTDDLITAYELTPDQNTPLPIQAPSPPEKNDYEISFDIRIGDIDTNRHVNNVRYIEWALETLPPDFFSSGKSASRILVDYRKEINYGDRVYAYADHVRPDNQQPESTRHRISNGKKDACLLTFYWR